MDDIEKEARVQSAILQKFTWRKVTAPKPWKPRPGEELAGFYGGKTVKNGRYGQYAAIFIRVPGRGTVMVSGARAVQLFDASLVEVGTPVHLLYTGKVDIGNDKTMHGYELNVADENPIEAIMEQQEAEFC